MVRDVNLRPDRLHLRARTFTASSRSQAPSPIQPIPIGHTHKTVAYAQLERGILAERVKAGMERARRQGRHVGRPAKADPAPGDCMAPDPPGDPGRRTVTPPSSQAPWHVGTHGAPIARRNSAFVTARLTALAVTSPVPRTAQVSILLGVEHCGGCPTGTSCPP